MPLSVNGEVIERSLIEQEAHALGRRFQEMPAEQREAQGLDAKQFQHTLWEWSQENLIERALLRLVAAAGLFSLALLFGLTQVDYRTRVTEPAPMEVPQQLRDANHGAAR